MPGSTTSCARSTSPSCRWWCGSVRPARMPRERARCCSSCAPCLCVTVVEQGPAPGAAGRPRCVERTTGGEPARRARGRRGVTPKARASSPTRGSVRARLVRSGRPTACGRRSGSSSCASTAPRSRPRPARWSCRPRRWSARGRPPSAAEPGGAVHRLDLGGQVLHRLISPSIAYFLFVAGLALLVFEFYTASIGLAGLVGAAVSARSSGFSLPVNWWAFALLVVAALGFAIDVQAASLGFWTMVSAIGLAVGSLFIYGGSAELGPPWWVLLVVSLGMLFMLGGMTAMIRARFSTPTVGREGMVGETGLAEVDISPDGVVVIRRALAGPHQPGDADPGGRPGQGGGGGGAGPGGRAARGWCAGLPRRGPPPQLTATCATPCLGRGPGVAAPRDHGTRWSETGRSRLGDFVGPSRVGPARWEISWPSAHSMSGVSEPPAAVPRRRCSSRRAPRAPRGPRGPGAAGQGDLRAVRGSSGVPRLRPRGRRGPRHLGRPQRDRAAWPQGDQLQLTALATPAQAAGLRPGCRRGAG